MDNRSYKKQNVLETIRIVDFSQWENLIHRTNTKEMNAPLVFTTTCTYNLYIQPRKIKKLTNKHWPIIQSNPLLSNMFLKPQLVAFKKAQNIKEKLIRAKLTKDTQQVPVSKNLLPDNDDSGYQEDHDETLAILVSLLNEQKSPGEHIGI